MQSSASCLSSTSKTIERAVNNFLCLSRRICADVVFCAVLWICRLLSIKGTTCPLLPLLPLNTNDIYNANKDYWPCFLVIMLVLKLTNHSFAYDARILIMFTIMLTPSSVITVENTLFISSAIKVIHPDTAGAFAKMCTCLGCSPPETEHFANDWRLLIVKRIVANRAPIFTGFTNFYTPSAILRTIYKTNCR